MMRISWDEEHRHFQNHTSKGANMDNSTTHPRIVPITLAPPRISKKVMFVVALAFFGVCSLVSGIISIILLSNGILPAPAGSLWIQIGYELSLGAWMLVSASALARGKWLSVWLYAGSILIDGLYHLLMGYPLNYLFMAFGVVLVWQLLRHRNDLNLI
jgi:hypothetical protein